MMMVVVAAAQYDMHDNNQILFVCRAALRLWNDATLYVSVVFVVVVVVDLIIYRASFTKSLFTESTKIAYSSARQSNELGFVGNCW